MNRLVFSAAFFAVLSLTFPACVGAVGSPGDVNADGLLDQVDANLLTAGIAIGSLDPTLDVNGDSAVDETDLNLFFENYSSENSVPLAIALVDVNFDKMNTAADFQILLSTLSTSKTDFTAGNLVPDGVVDVNDRDRYLSRGGVVPEPASLSIAAVGCLALGALRRLINSRRSSG